MNGRVTAGDPLSEWEGGTLDSRRIEGGELFFALPGEQVDGHRFVAGALAQGAAGAVVHTSVGVVPRGSVVEVDDTYRALHDLTRMLRSAAPRRLVAVTGSVGKTTTKELLAALLGQRYAVAKSPGNLNNLYGFPLALMGIPESTEWMVAEMGMSTPGELGAVSRLGRPDVAVFVNVRPVHLERLGTLAAVIDAKAELLDGLAPDGLVVANADDPSVMEIASRHRGRVITFGRGESADYRAADLRPRGPGLLGTWFALSPPSGPSVEVELGLHGDYNVENFLAAAAAAHALGVPLVEIAALARSLEPVVGRGVVHELHRGVTLIDDSYNSNPAALRGALESAAALAGDRRHWAVLGEMLELGSGEIGYHRAEGEAAAVLGFSPVVGVGELARHLVDAAAGAGVSTSWFPSASEAAAEIAGAVRPGDVVLVKGSRGVALEVVVAGLMEDEG